MKGEPEEEPEPAAEKKAQEHECSETELKQVSGGVMARQKGTAPGYSPGASIDM